MRKSADKGGVRKWIVIGLAVLAVIGAGGYMLSLPRKGTVEWHKREYLAAMNGPSISERVKRTARRLMGRAHSFGVSGERLNRIRQHQSALIELGFLERRELALTNLPYIPVKQLQWSVFSGATGRIPPDRLRFSQFSATSAEVLTVIAPPQDMPILEGLIRKLDVPETAN
jgi:hypothetical protein